MNLNEMDLNDYMASEEEGGLFACAFKPLRERLNQQAEACQKQHTFSPWVISTGKGGSEKPGYLAYPDVSLYRHCMDVAIIGAMLFFYAWQKGKLSDITDEKAAEKALKILFAIAFLHDADKYRDSALAFHETDSESPTYDQVKALYEVLAVDHWTDLTVEDCFALVSRVEINRGKKQAIFAEPPSDRQMDILAEMVSVGDTLTSIASREGFEQMIAAYNQRLAALVAQYAVPNDKLKLWVFEQTPVVLCHLQQVFLDQLYDEYRFPLVCLLEGQRLWISLQADFDLEAVFKVLEENLSQNFPSIKRNHTNGELNLLHLHDVETLIREATDAASYGSRFLTIHSKDWDQVITYIRSWAASVSGLVVLEKGTGKLLLPLAPDTKTQEYFEPTGQYRYALAIAAALRVDSKGKVFDERIQRLKSWQEGGISTALQQALPEIDMASLDKNTRQALYAMQAAMEITSEAQLIEIIDYFEIAFPPRQENLGSRAIVNSLKQQCGLASEPALSAEPLYAAAPKGGTCLLCGLPATQTIETSRMTLAGIKSTAFNNRIGQQKTIWSQSGNNYLCEGCIKQQALLCQTLKTTGHRATGMPLLVATPFRGLIKPLETEDKEKPFSVINSFTAVNYKDQGWLKVLPWTLDISETTPLLLETVDTDFDSLVDTMYRMANYAAHSGNPVHVFISAPRASKAAFLFEPTPPLIRTLLADLSQPNEPNAIRRDKLPWLVKRLELIRQILNSNNGHDVLSILPAYQWWAVAWLNDRLIAQDKFYFSDNVHFAKEVYPMNADPQIEKIAQLAAQIQRNPGYKATNNERIFALTTALEQYDTGLKYQQSEPVTVAAMAETLATALDRRDMFAKGEGAFSQRCKAFAQAVYDFVKHHKQEGQFDARFQRFFLAAYAFLFMEVCSNKPKSTQEESSE